VGRIVRFGDAVLDIRAARVERGGRVLTLEPRTYDLLLYLVERPGELVSHNDLLDRIWGEVNVTAHSLTQAISQLRQALGDDSHAPRYIETVHRRGYRWVAPVEIEEIVVAGSDEPGGTGWSLPPAKQDLIGREDLILAVVSAIESARVVTLIGSGGVGKTQLALEAGRRTTPAFQHGSAFVDLTPESEFAGVARAVARALRITPGDRPPSIDTLALALCDRNLLLVVDNCEQVAEAVGELASALTARCPRLHLLITTQRRLTVPGQTMLRVSPLELPSSDWTAAPPSIASPWPAAIRLFVERARAVNPDFILTPENGDAVAEICRRLDGVPLALELAAARANVLTPAQIAERLDERLQLLAGRGDAALSRHQSLEAAISWSVSLLPERSRRLFDGLAVFSGGWSLEAEEAVVDADGKSDVVNELGTLVDRSLVTADTGRSRARYRLLESIRLYARKRLIESPDHSATRDRHLACFCEFGRQVEREIMMEPLPWLRRVREEYANLRDAVAWAAASRRNAEDGLRLCCDLRWAWRLEGNYVESMEWLTRALESAPDASDELAGRALNVLGLIQHHRGDLDGARSTITRALATLPASEEWEHAFGTALLAFIETMSGSSELAGQRAKEAERRARVLNDPQLVGFNRVTAGMAAGLAGRPAEAVEAFVEARNCLEQGWDPFLHFFSSVQLGLQRYLAGDLAGSRDDSIAALRAACELDNLRGIAGPLEILGYLDLARNDYGRAARRMGAASRLREITGAPVLANFLPAHLSARAALDGRLGGEGALREMQAGADTPLAEMIAEVFASS
jgi:predicted ATPase/DNA-binding winged helix-turn-helix (wHTH) protein